MGLYASLAGVLVTLVCAVTRRNPYAFYTFLRWVCCAGFAYSAFASRLLGKQAWTAIFGIQAALFNLFVEFHFRRDTWQALGKLAIAGVVVAAVMFGKELRAAKDA